MSVQSFEGVVENGVVRLADGARLPEGARVYVLLPDPVRLAGGRIASPRLVRPQDVADFTKTVLLDGSDA